MAAQDVSPLVREAPDAGMAPLTRDAPPMRDAPISRAADAPPAWRRLLSPASLLRLGALVGFFGIWETAARTGLVDPLFAASPTLIVEKFAEMLADGSIWPHVAATAEVAAMGFALSVAVGVPVGLVMGRIAARRLDHRALRRGALCLAAGRLPAAAHHLARHRLLVQGRAGLSRLLHHRADQHRDRRRAGRSAADRDRALLHGRERQILLKIVLPSALPFIIAGMRLAIGRALVMVVVAEIYASNKGSRLSDLPGRRHVRHRAGLRRRRASWPPPASPSTRCCARSSVGSRRGEQDQTA